MGLNHIMEWEKSARFQNNYFEGVEKSLANLCRECVTTCDLIRMIGKRVKEKPCRNEIIERCLRRVG